ncbi:MAG TPA: phosphoglucomutase/phosphomannomutase family protein [Candidatus Limnocylindrales bacterium]|nr:phosphoglucomutase/phosphomannomutase family protein [Candidatus Limnocylindrales bacterium]
MTDGSASAPLPPIVFGTDGWRARIGEDYTYENVRRCAQGVAEWARSAGTSQKGVVIAYDRRFASEFFAQAAAEVLLAYDIPVAMSQNAVPTQMTSYEVVERGAACGIMITASHNPYPDNGFKVKSPSGAAASPDMLAVIEKTIRDYAGSQPPRQAYAEAVASGKVELYDPYPGYVEYTRRSLDLDRLKAADMRVLVEPMWGAGAGWISRLLAGGRIQITEIHQERNPFFGGVNPEPIRPNIDESLSLLAAGGYDLGLLLDGDADRAGAADEKGTFIHQLQVMGLLMYYMVEHRGLRQPVVSTINETSMVGRLGEKYGVDVFETPVGFKYVGPKMIETGAMMGGEESGGYGFGMHLPERDGIYADLLLLDLFIREREAGRWPVSAAVEHLHSIAGQSFYLRSDVHVDRQAYPALKDRLLVELVAQAPTSVAGHPVIRTDELSTKDGFKFWLDDGSWLLVRFSGTEPLVRVYAEATSADLRDGILAEGSALVRGEAG